MGRFLLDFFSYFEDMVVDGSRGWKSFVAPDFIEQRIPGDHLPGVLDKIFEDLRFERR